MRAWVQGAYRETFGTSRKDNGGQTFFNLEFVIARCGVLRSEAMVIGVVAFDGCCH
jgi:hypothetical protein